jgi:hypothetical protein
VVVGAHAGPSAEPEPPALVRCPDVPPFVVVGDDRLPASTTRERHLDVAERGRVQAVVRGLKLDRRVSLRPAARTLHRAIVGAPRIRCQGRTAPQPRSNDCCHAGVTCTIGTPACWLSVLGQKPLGSRDWPPVRARARPADGSGNPGPIRRRGRRPSMEDRSTSGTGCHLEEPRGPEDGRCPFCASARIGVTYVEFADLLSYPRGAFRRHLACDECQRRWYDVIPA